MTSIWYLHFRFHTLISVQFHVFLFYSILIKCPKLVNWVLGFLDIIYKNDNNCFLMWGLKHFLQLQKNYIQYKVKRKN